MAATVGRWRMKWLHAGVVDSADYDAWRASGSAIHLAAVRPCEVRVFLSRHRCSWQHSLAVSCSMLADRSALVDFEKLFNILTMTCARGGDAHITSGQTSPMTMCKKFCCGVGYYFAWFVDVCTLVAWTGLGTDNKWSTTGNWDTTVPGDQVARPILWMAATAKRISA